MSIPKLILVEGITGSGKSNLAQWLALRLPENGIDCRWFFEFEAEKP